MKLIKLISIIISFCGIQFVDGSELSTVSYSNSTVESQIEALILEIAIVRNQYEIEADFLYLQLSKASKGVKTATNAFGQLKWLIKKDEIKEKIELLKLNEQTDISKIRYIKGLQIIKILYEKTLALDHHFASVSTFSEINKLSNPNHYTEFMTVKELIKSKKDKKSGFDLTSVLGNNIYTSVAHSFISLFTNTHTSKTDKEASLKKVECVLDFTLRMHNDLNTIYFETVFLQKNNENIMQELHQLFVDFTKPIHYKNSLMQCRDSDDWDNVREHLGIYLQLLDVAIGDETQQRKANKMQINLEFPIDRLLQFIIQYNAFIDQGAKFYEKFGIMLNSYENESQCASKLPIAFNKLKESIAIAIEKFNTAYKPVEINGSKMKEILYGINEYE